jgi:hypothetical protein
MHLQVSQVSAWKATGLPILCAIFMQAASASLWAQPKSEVRHFHVAIEGKPAGTYQMDIRVDSDGTETMIGSAHVNLKSYLIYNYRYQYSGTEVWRNGRLVQLESTTDDDGKKFNVIALPDPKTGMLLVRANNAQQPVRPDVWTTTYWRLASPQFRGKGVPLLDSDTGKYMEGTLQALGVDKINVLGRPQNCAHYRLTGGDKGALDVELWYDAQERMVRQVSIESGRRYTLTLTSIK